MHLATVFSAIILLLMHFSTVQSQRGTSGSQYGGGQGGYDRRDYGPDRSRESLKCGPRDYWDPREDETQGFNRETYPNGGDRETRGGNDGRSDQNYGSQGRPGGYESQGGYDRQQDPNRGYRPPREGPGGHHHHHPHHHGPPIIFYKCKVYEDAVRAQMKMLLENNEYGSCQQGDKKECCFNYLMRAKEMVMIRSPPNIECLEQVDSFYRMTSPSSTINYG